MGLGVFGDNGELLFEIQLIAANGEIFSVAPNTPRDHCHFERSVTSSLNH
ncbi:hypothetical protein ACF3DV_32725 [Chlorogloeopsis fritschii PCC 9212]|nr:hypothetical protein [Chlorogloeopsis fritschii]